ncbi:MAG: polyphosphate kinase 2 family protein [Thermoanaerobaculia bacterium]
MSAAVAKRYRVKPGQRVHLADYDPDETKLAPGGKKEAADENKAIEAKLSELQELLYAEHKRKVLIVLQGMDTSGKDGTVLHVMAAFNPAGVRVVSFKKPTAIELEHDYLWRVHSQAPGAGEIVVFNRSHYEDVLVVRVHSLVPKEVWSRRYDQINDFERMLSENDTLVLKFFFNISKEEQRKRLEARIADPQKRWKFQHGDVEERKLWDEYASAYEAVLEKTSTEWAPWFIVPANTKWYRNYVVGSIVCRALEKLKMRYPEPDLSNEKID